MCRKDFFSTTLEDAPFLLVEVFDMVDINKMTVPQSNPIYLPILVCYYSRCTISSIQSATLWRYSVVG